MNNPAQTSEGASSPSIPSQQQPDTAGSSHTQASSQDKAGTPLRLLAVVLPATDLLSGNERSEAVVLELCAVEMPSGFRRNVVGWHGPFPTQLAASDFVSQLAKQPPTVAGDPIAARTGL